MKLFIKIVVCVFAAFLLIGGGGIFFMSRGLGAGSELVINDVDLSLVEDGVYTGTYKAGRWTNEVRVEVQDHQVTKVELLKDVTFAKPEVTAELFAQVVQNQKVNIDVISGSTVTCKAYLKAIENALSQQ